MPINAVFIDLGDVLVPLNYEKMYQAFNALGIKNAKAQFNTDVVKKLWKDYDNSLPTATFRAGLREHLQLPGTVTDDQIDQAWNALYDPIPQIRLDFLLGLKKQGIQVCLVSNNNEIHHKHTLVTYGPVFQKIFAQQFYSNKMGVAKPDIQFFEMALRARQLKPEQVLFLDDKEPNIQGGLAAGVHAMQFTVNDPMTKVSDKIFTIDQQEKYLSIATTHCQKTLMHGLFAAATVATGVVGYLLSGAQYQQPKPK